MRAHALFASARVAEQKQNYALALRDYAARFRFDPAAVSALREIVPLAFNLDRQAEAVRYAQLLAEHDPSDLLLLRRLAINLSEDGDSQRALRLYEKALELSRASGEKPNSAAVLTWMEMGRLYFLEKKYDQAAERFDDVAKALAAPQEYGLDATMQKALLSKAELTYQLFGEVFLEANRPADALAAFEKAQAIKPDEALHLYNLARVDARQKQPAQALAKLETYFDKHYTSQGTGAYQLLGQVLEALGQQGQLIERLEKLHAADPENVPLAYELAQQYRQADQLDRAEPIYRALVERQKNRPPAEAVAALVDVYRRQKNAGRVLDLLGQTAERPRGHAGRGEKFAGRRSRNGPRRRGRSPPAARRRAGQTPLRCAAGRRHAGGRTKGLRGRQRPVRRGPESRQGPPGRSARRLGTRTAHRRPVRRRRQGLRARAGRKNRAARQRPGLFLSLRCAGDVGTHPRGAGSGPQGRAVAKGFAPLRRPRGLDRIPRQALRVGPPELRRPRSRGSTSSTTRRKPAT